MSPLVSVVISTYNRPQRLERLLAALRCQALPRGAFEVIVVDDGSGGSATAEVLAAEEQRGELQLRTIRHAVPRGPAAGRNSGWRVAKATLVAFTDDDCEPEERWLAAGLAVAEHRDSAGAVDREVIVQGRTIPDPDEDEGDQLLSHTVSIEQLGPQYQTCNIFYPRRLLESLGGFDEDFGAFSAGEDTDLAWRALERGWSAVFAPDAVVRHAVERIGASGQLRLAARWSTAVRLFADHPQLRSMLYRRTFWNVWHYLMWRSLIALFAPAWLRRLLLTLHLAQLRKRSREAGASGIAMGAWAVPFLVVHDLVECWAIARGAVRHRVVLL